MDRAKSIVDVIVSTSSMELIRWPISKYSSLSKSHCGAKDWSVPALFRRTASPGPSLCTIRCAATMPRKEKAGMRRLVVVVVVVVVVVARRIAHLRLAIAAIALAAIDRDTLSTVYCHVVSAVVVGVVGGGVGVVVGVIWLFAASLVAPPSLLRV